MLTPPSNIAQHFHTKTKKKNKQTQNQITKATEKEFLYFINNFRTCQKKL